jgi:serpin B
MMSSSQANAGLEQGIGWNAAIMAYAGGTTSMILLVPDAGTFNAFEQALTADGLATTLASKYPQRCIVTMPRFGFSTSLSLKNVLETLGMMDAVDSSLADLSAMDGAHDLYVGNVIHKAVIAVDEKGTTAAAATGVTTGVMVVLPQTPTPLVVDRPFLFFIRHNPTGAILFQGRVVDPTQAE